MLIPTGRIEGRRQRPSRTGPVGQATRSVRAAANRLAVRSELNARSDPDGHGGRRSDSLSGGGGCRAGASQTSALGASSEDVTRLPPPGAATSCSSCPGVTGAELRPAAARSGEPLASHRLDPDRARRAAGRWRMRSTGGLRRRRTRSPASPRSGQVSGSPGRRAAIQGSGPRSWTSRRCVPLRGAAPRFAERCSPLRSGVAVRRVSRPSPRPDERSGPPHLRT